jgi:hypothetical protein
LRVKRQRIAPAHVKRGGGGSKIHQIERGIIINATPMQNKPISNCMPLRLFPPSLSIEMQLRITENIPQAPLIPAQTIMLFMSFFLLSKEPKQTANEVHDKRKYRKPIKYSEC